MSFCQCGKVFPWKVHGQTCSSVGALLHVLAAILLYLVSHSASPHLSLSSCTVRNICPKLVQSCNHSSPRGNYALDSISSTTVSSWKLILSFHIFASKYYKCPPWKFISYLYMPPEPLFHQGFCFPSEILSVCVFFWSPSSFKQIEGIESSLWH